MKTQALKAPPPEGPASPPENGATAKAPRWRNPYRRLPRLRWAVQGAFLLFLVLVGIEFSLFFGQAVSGGAVTAGRPPAVEGFLPISALVGLVRFLATGRYDEVHPAGLTILIGAIVSSVAARKVFCSWVCPVGTLSRALEWAGKRLLFRRRRKETLVPRPLDIGLSSLKYLLLVFFLWVIGVQMDAAALEGFMHTAYNYAADAKMLLFFAELSVTAAVTLAVLALLSVLVKNFWCRYLCPYGALLGLAGLLSPQRVVRDAAVCTDCKACTRACPVEIAVHRKDKVWTPECTACLSCVAACPVEDCLTLGRRGRKGWSPYVVPVAGLGVIFLVWGVARLTGHWHTELSVPALAEAYRQARFLAHP
jgi:ferredoxin